MRWASPAWRALLLAKLAAAFRGTWLGRTRLPLLMSAQSSSTAQQPGGGDVPSLPCVRQVIERRRGLPKEQLVLPIHFPQSNCTLDFVLDTISRDTIISERAAALLGVTSEESLANGQVKRVGDFRVAWGPKVELPAARLGNANEHFFAVLDGVVVNMEKLGFSERLGGVLGLDALSKFDLDFDFQTLTVGIYLAGALERGLIDTSGLEGLSCGVLPGGKLGLKMELNGGGPFTGVLDLGSNSSAGNWAAARDLDVTALVAGAPSSLPRETGRSRPLFRARFDTVQLGHVLLTSAAAAAADGAGSGDEGLLQVYIGYLPEFDALGADVAGKTDRSRQLAMVGQDLVAHTRLVLSCKSKRLFFKPREVNDLWAGQVV